MTITASLQIERVKKLQAVRVNQGMGSDDSKVDPLSCRVLIEIKKEGKQVIGLQGFKVKCPRREA